MQLRRIEFSFRTGLKVGFATVLALLLALMAVGLYSVQRMDRHLETIVKSSLGKARLANAMQIALRERAVSMHSIAAMDDPFDKDLEYLEFNTLGQKFLKSRKALEELPLNDAEKAALARVSAVTRRTQPLVVAVIEKALVAETPQERMDVSKIIRTDAISNQRLVAAELDKLMALQDEAVQRGTEGAHAVYQHARQLILGLGTLAAGLGFLIAFLSIRNATSQTDKLRHQAMFDELTDLPNRVLFQDRLQQAILASQRENRPFALLALDLNRFKEVNDTLGHQQGDALLRQVALRLTTFSRQSDTIARMGGDEFSLLLPATNALGATVFAKKIMTSMEEIFDLDGKSVEIGASIGIALFPEHGANCEILMRHADSAMYVAKRATSGFEMFDSKQTEAESLDFSLKAELRQAIEKDQLVLYFQPKISHLTRKITGVEALVRWQHPIRGLIPPDRFIPIAEQTGLIRPLTAWVLDHAIQQCAQLHHLGMPLTMAVNLSTINLKDPELPHKIIAVLEKNQLDPKWLELEITESAIMDDTMRTVQVLADLDKLGAKISIDDYGTGYSSLSYFKKLPLDDIKIDKSFVIGMSGSHDDATIVRSTIEMGHELGLRVVAEGVEDVETWNQLCKLGCDEAQGYFMSRPLPAADLLKWLCESPWAYQNVENAEEAPSDSV
jgi:diguanylate cyclase (GGDEF)-like protein